MKNYYELLDIPYNANINQIRSSYQYNIAQFNNLPFLTNNNIVQVKDFKKALYILSNPTLRNLYNNKLEEYLEKYKTRKETNNQLKEENNVKEEFNYEPEVQGANTFDTFEENLDGSTINYSNDYSNDFTNDYANDYTNDFTNIKSNNKLIDDASSIKATEVKKNKLNANIIGDRIFSLSHLNKTPVLNDFHLKLRKPENGRIEKNH
jgi:DnaJ-class molecular chaperone